LTSSARERKTSSAPFGALPEIGSLADFSDNAHRLIGADLRPAAVALLHETTPVLALVVCLAIALN